MPSRSHRVHGILGLSADQETVRDSWGSRKPDLGWLGWNSVALSTGNSAQDATQRLPARQSSLAAAICALISAQEVNDAQADCSSFVRGIWYVSGPGGQSNRRSEESGSRLGAGCRIQE